MRNSIRWIIRTCLVLLSLDSIITFIDYFGRWDFLETAMKDHPALAAIVRAPTFPLLCLGVCILAIYGEKYLKVPQIKARFTNAQIMPNLHTATMKDFFDSEEKRPGWDEKKLDWWWFVEVYVVNESETITIDTVHCRAKVGRRDQDAQLHKDLGAFKIDRSLKADGTENTTRIDPKKRYDRLPSLLQQLSEKPLEKGIFKRGWLRFELRQVSQKDMNSGRLKLEIWLVDAFQNKHPVDHNKTEEGTWDKSFLIYEEL